MAKKRSTATNESAPPINHIAFIKAQPLADRVAQGTAEFTSKEIASAAGSILHPGGGVSRLRFRVMEAAQDKLGLMLSAEDVQVLNEFVGQARRVAASALTQRG